MRLELPPGANKSDVQAFTPDPDGMDQEWVKPLDAVFVDILCIGPGGAGGSGSVSGPGETAYGGGGGTGGGISRYGFMAVTLPDTLVIAPGATTGGVGVTAGVGEDGGYPTSNTVVSYPDTYVTLLRAGGGLPGSGGGGTFLTGEKAPTADNARVSGQFTSSSGGVGGPAAGRPTSQGQPESPGGLDSGAAPGPGGGGGGIDMINAVGQGGWGSSVTMFGAYGAESGVGQPGLQPARTYDVYYVANPGVDAFVSVDRAFGIPGPGGSGGASAVDADGGAGASGGAWGGGGGGGGAARTGFTSGAGGDGGPGLIIITTSF